MGVIMAIISKFLLLVILITDIYLAANLGVSYFKITQLDPYFKPINDYLGQYPLYANIALGIIVFIAAMTAKRGLISILLFGAIGFALYNLYFLGIV